MLVNQGCIKSLCQHLTGASMYGLYHILHAHIAEECFAIDDIDEVTSECLKMLNHGSMQKAPIELFWLLFLLSCDPNQHEKLAHEPVINCCLDTCTYEIFQKSDPRSGHCIVVSKFDWSSGSYTVLFPFDIFFWIRKIQPA